MHFTQNPNTNHMKNMLVYNYNQPTISGKKKINSPKDGMN